MIYVSVISCLRDCSGPTLPRIFMWAPLLLLRVQLRRHLLHEAACCVAGKCESPGAKAWACNPAPVLPSPVIQGRLPHLLGGSSTSPRVAVRQSLQQCCHRASSLDASASVRSWPPDPGVAHPLLATGTILSSFVSFIVHVTKPLFCVRVCLHLQNPTREPEHCPERGSARRRFSITLR